MPEIKELENKIKELEDKVATLENQITAKDTVFDDLTSQVKEAERLLKNHRHQGEETPFISRIIATEVLQIPHYASPPAGKDGRFYYDTTLKRLRHYHNGEWRSVWTD